jgi:thiol-disulfide isomerase/thioredoxin
VTITREQFAEGLDADTYVAEKVEANRDRFLQNISEFELTDEDKAFFAEHPISVAAFGEDWCTDVVQFLPVVIKLSKEAPNVDLRIFERDDNVELMTPYLKEGKYQSIPVFVVMDEQWAEKGHFIERPAAVTQKMAEETVRFAKANPDLEGANRSYENMPEATRTAVRANSSDFRWSNAAEWNRIFIDELKALATS